MEKLDYVDKPEYVDNLNYIEESDCIRVVLIDMPPAIHGFTVSDGFGFYTVVLNPRLSAEMQRMAYNHEISHIKNGDFDRMQDANRDMMDDMSIDQLEKIRHEL